MILAWASPFKYFTAFFKHDHNILILELKYWSLVQW